MILPRAGRWFLSSGIQQEGDGVARYYRADQQHNLPVSTEITGYAASTYAWLYKVTGAPLYRDAAARTADFLVEKAWNPGLQTFPFELAPGSPAYFFDCGIIARGLRAAWKITGVEEFDRVARLAARSMARDFLTPHAIHPVVSLPDRVPCAYENRWSRQPGCFQLKSALAWRDAGMHQEWESAVELALGNARVFLPGELEEEKVMDRLHAFCYFLEGLLAAAQSGAHAAVLRESIERTAGYLRAVRPHFERSDVYAQLLRIRLFADAFGAVPLDRAQAAEEAAAAAAFQYPDECGPRLAGGFSFGRRQNELLPFVNPVSTAFCLQALFMWELYQQGRFEPVVDELI
jgi:hypothetical protein